MLILLDLALFVALGIVVSLFKLSASIKVPFDLFRSGSVPPMPIRTRAWLTALANTIRGVSFELMFQMLLHSVGGVAHMHAGVGRLQDLEARGDKLCLLLVVLVRAWERANEVPAHG